MGRVGTGSSVHPGGLVLARAPGKSPSWPVRWARAEGGQAVSKHPSEADSKGWVTPYLSRLESGSQEHTLFVVVVGVGVFA